MGALRIGLAAALAAGLSIGCYRSHERSDPAAPTRDAGARDASTPDVGEETGCRTSSVHWAIQSIDTRGEGHTDLAVAVDDAGRAHLSYIWDGQLWYASAGSAPESIRDRVPRGGRRATDMAIDPDGGPRVAFFAHGMETSAVGVHYAARSSGGWEVELVTPWGSLFNIVRRPSVFFHVHDDGRAAMVYRASADYVRVARSAGGAWAGDGAYLFSSLASFAGAVASDGALHTLHVEVDHEYDPRGGPIAIEESTVWSAGGVREVLHTTRWEAVDGSFSTRREPGRDYLALAFDGETTHAAFAVALPGVNELRHRGRGGSSAIVHRSERSIGEVGLALDAMGAPHASFVEDGALRHAWRGPLEWHVEPVGGLDGEEPRIAVARDGTVFVAFTDESGVQLASRTPATCE